MRAQLIPLNDAPFIEILKDLTLVGRKDECDVCLPHKSVSKMHCVIVKTDGLLLLRDLGSTNGTRVNGQRVRRAALLPNDQLAIASYKYRVEFGPDVVKPAEDQHTQRLDAREVARLLQRTDQPNGPKDSDEMPAPPLPPNLLPDVYPEEPKSKP